METTNTSTEYQEFLAKGARSPELLAPLVIPEPVPVVYTEEELKKIEAERAFETAFDVTFTSTPEWGQSFFRHDGYIYYYKPYLEYVFSQDLQNIEEDLSNTTQQANIAKVQSFLGYANKKDVIGSTSLADIQAIIDLAPAGMPPFVAETANFYKFVDICETAITIDDVNKELLDQIKSTFTDNQYSVYYSNLGWGLYKKNGNLYFANLVHWKKTPGKKIGIFVSPDQNTEKYPAASSTSYFFPFDTLNQDELDFVNTFNAQDNLYGTITINYL